MAADVWVEGLRPYWDYWIEESGGAEELKAWTRQSVSTKSQTWIGAFDNEKLVGLAMIRPNSYGLEKPDSTVHMISQSFAEKE